LRAPVPLAGDSPRQVDDVRTYQTRGELVPRGTTYIVADTVVIGDETAVAGKGGQAAGAGGHAVGPGGQAASRHGQAVGSGGVGAGGDVTNVATGSGALAGWKGKASRGVSGGANTPAPPRRDYVHAAVVFALALIVSFVPLVVGVMPAGVAAAAIALVAGLIAVYRLAKGI